MEDFKITEHFSFYELTDSKRHPELVPQNRVDAMAYQKQLKYTACAHEEIRAVLGVPLNMSSGYRNPRLNKIVGGSPTSGHTKGLCGDSIPRMDVKKAFEILLRNKDKLPSVKKVILENFGGDIWLHTEAKVEVNQPQKFYTTTNGKTYMEVV